MKQPKLTNLTIDYEGTRKLRAQMKRSRSVKITINIEEQPARAQKNSGRPAIPYQRILSQVLKEASLEKADAQSRLDRIERELAKLKRQIAA